MISLSEYINEAINSKNIAKIRREFIKDFLNRCDDIIDAGFKKSGMEYRIMPEVTNGNKKTAVYIEFTTPYNNEKCGMRITPKTANQFNDKTSEDARSPLFWCKAHAQFEDKQGKEAHYKMETLTPTVDEALEALEQYLSKLRDVAKGKCPEDITEPWVGKRY